MNQLVALGAGTRRGALDSFLGGKQAALGQQRAQMQNQSLKLKQVQQGMQMIGSVALGAMGGDLNGQVDPQKYEQGLDLLQQQGMDVSAYRGKPDMAKVAAQGSMDVLQAINARRSQQELELRLRQFDMQMMSTAAQLERMRVETERENVMFPLEVEQAQSNIAKTRADAAKKAIPPATKGQEATDKEFAKEFVDWKARGGYADVEKNLEQLRLAKKALEGGNDSISGRLVGVVPDRLRDQESIRIRDMVSEVVQRNLRLILGAQFTEKEGQQLIQRAYNENLSEAENAQRVGRLIDSIEAAARAKQSASDYFEQNGTLTGWTETDRQQQASMPVGERRDLTPAGTPENAVVKPVGGAPQAGVIEDGYRFKGGDPSDPNAWEKVN